MSAELQWMPAELLYSRTEDPTAVAFAVCRIVTAGWALALGYVLVGRC